MHDCNKRHTNLRIAWIDYKKVYDMILELVQVSQNIVEFIRKAMKDYNTDFTSCGEYLAYIDIRRAIFQGGSLSPLLFVFCMILLTQILRKVKSG